MSVITKCSSCGMDIFTNPPIKEMMCEKCEEVIQLKLEVSRLRGENEWLYGKLNQISRIIEKGRKETPKEYELSPINWDED